MEKIKELKDFRKELDFLFSNYLFYFGNIKQMYLVKKYINDRILYFSVIFDSGTSLYNQTVADGLNLINIINDDINRFVNMNIHNRISLFLYDIKLDKTLELDISELINKIRYYILPEDKVTPLKIVVDNTK